MGIAGFFLVLLMLWGVTKWCKAEDPDDDHQGADLEGASRSRARSPARSGLRCRRGRGRAAGVGQRRTSSSPSRPRTSRSTGPQFDPIAKPDTKKENPNVLPIGRLPGRPDSRAPMKGFDIIPATDGRAEDRGHLRQEDRSARPGEAQAISATKFKKKGRKGTEGLRPKAPPGSRRHGPGLPAAPGGPGGPPGGRRPGGGRVQAAGGEGGDNPVRRSGGSGFDAGTAVEKAIEYVPLDELDKAIAKQKVPAMTVIPLRMVTIHAEVPLKEQIEEIRGRCALANVDEATEWGPVYDGLRGQAADVTSFGPKGEEVVIQDWADYDFEDEYQTLIDSRKRTTTSRTGYLSLLLPVRDEPGPAAAANWSPRLGQVPGHPAGDHQSRRSRS